MLNLLQWITGIIVASGGLTAIMKKWKFGPWVEDMSSQDNDIMPIVTPIQPVKAVNDSIPHLDFSTPQKAFKSVRVICDEMGLPLEKTVVLEDMGHFYPKDIVCAVVFQESEFLTNPKPNQNKDKNGKVWSTDYGIVQVNDHFHIGKSKEFASIDEVLNNPEKCIRWLVGIYKATGVLQPWSSYTSGSYKRWLLTGSPMWNLKT